MGFAFHDRDLEQPGAHGTLPLRGDLKGRTGGRGGWWHQGQREVAGQVGYTFLPF